MLGMQMAQGNDGYSQRVKTFLKDDVCDWLFAINEASVVANTRNGLLEKDTAIAIRAALAQLQSELAQDGAVRPKLYITFEPLLLKKTGIGASVLHIGRSSQDILATTQQAITRTAVLTLADAVLALENTLLELARTQGDAIVPNYTNGVQAQPNRYAHYVYAQAFVFLRILDRFKALIQRYDICPMGAGVLNGGAWPIDCDYMAHALGFAQAPHNAYDVGQLTCNDLPLEFAQIVQSIMLWVVSFLQDFTVQYAQTRPWVLLDRSGSTYISSAMPQKRNPGMINDCRRDAGVVFNEAGHIAQRMHGLPTGMADVRDMDLFVELTVDATRVIEIFTDIVAHLKINRERALEEINADWSCTQHLAGTLMQKAGIAFRAGHHAASAWVSYARANVKTPSNTTYGDMCEFWISFVKDHPELPQAFPLSEDEFKATLDPECIVEARATAGGPQKASLEAQRAELQTRLATFASEFEAVSARIAQAHDKRKADLAAL